MKIISFMMSVAAKVLFRYCGIGLLLFAVYGYAAPTEYDGGLENISTEIDDLDRKQTQARYDPKLLLSDDLSGSYSSSSSQEDATAAACILNSSNRRYEHGQKLPRTDPCEVCLCVDGEIFCWWKKCGNFNSKKYNIMGKEKGNRDKSVTRINGKWTKTIPSNIVNFPKHLPLNILNENVEKFQIDDGNKINPLRNTEQSEYGDLNIPENILNSNKPVPTVGADGQINSTMSLMGTVISRKTTQKADEHYVITATGTIENMQTRSELVGDVKQDKKSQRDDNVDDVNSAELAKKKDSDTQETINDCIVMGKTYRVGTVLPQEAGNCLQCVCVEGINYNDPPRVTCNPHNCPPLILPDLFDANGY